MAEKDLDESIMPVGGDIYVTPDNTVDPDEQDEEE